MEGEEQEEVTSLYNKVQNEARNPAPLFNEVFCEPEIQHVSSQIDLC